MKTIGMINRLFAYPMAAAMTGFGMFWFYRIFGFNIWVCIIVGLYTSALISRVLP